MDEWTDICGWMDWWLDGIVDR